MVEVWLLRWILWTLEESLAVQLRSYEAQQDSKEILLQSLDTQQQILAHLTQPPAAPNATSLTIGVVLMQQFDPGASGIVLQAAFTPAGSTAPNAGFSVSWTDSNNFCTFANDASDSTGLTQDVTVGTGATVGATGVITATLTGTFPDGSTANLTGTFNYTIGAAPVGNATGLGITQIA